MSASPYTPSLVLAAGMIVAGAAGASLSIVWVPVLALAAVLQARGLWRRYQR